MTPLPNSNNLARKAIYAALTHAADQSLPCPLNRDLDALIAGSTTPTAWYHVKRMQMDGLIAIEHRDTKRRRIRIVATGRVTGWAVHKKPLRYC